MPEYESHENAISRDCLAELLNEDLSREYQAIIAYVVYSQEIRAAPNNSTSRSGDIRTSLARGR
jgi:bacterioferritin